MAITALKDALRESLDIYQKLLDDPSLDGFERNFVRCASCIVSALRQGNTVLLAGNGGSAADAQHFAAELVGKYRKKRKGLPAIALTTDSSILTAVSNDFSFEEVFARSVEALGNPGDVFIGISTSGNSKNIIAALDRARHLQMFTIGLLGGTGGRSKELCDYTLIVPTENTPRIQECHTLLLHALCEEIDKELTW